MSNWTPHSFKRLARAEDTDEPFIELLAEEGERLRNAGLPVVFTLGHLTALCDAPYTFLRQIVERRHDPYRVFNIKKSGGGYRQITVPEATLMRVQRWVHENMLKNANVSKICTAYAPETGPVANAQRHCGCRWLVKMDVRSFFESISERQVYRVFRRIGYRPLIAFELTRLCTRVAPSQAKRHRARWRKESAPYSIDRYHTFALGHLPQGAPTSPMLANLVCLELDGRLEKIASDHHAVVTRYADDIVFSADKLDRATAGGIIKKVSFELSAFGFRRNEMKTHVVPPGARRIVTGLLVDSGTPHLSKAFRDKVRMHLFHARTKGVLAHCEKRKFTSLVGFREHLWGLISYAKQVDKQFAADCEGEFNKIPWGILDLY